jgi:probable selenium-dependent hydroxylase accessory protein YqeC
MRLTNLLNIQPGITAIIGGGGKTTLLRTLGVELAKENTVLLTTTTKIMPFEGIVLADTLEKLKALKRANSLLCAGTRIEDTGKLTAPDILFSKLAEEFTYVLVEADGAARKPMKAHAQHEPVIPAEANQVICVVGASGFGKAIKDCAHRPERYAELAGVSCDMLVTPETQAAVLQAEALHDRIYVNQVETQQAMDQALRLAELLDCPVVAGSMHEGEYSICSY